jgi:hypothetical protein
MTMRRRRVGLVAVTMARRVDLVAMVDLVAVMMGRRVDLAECVRGWE